MSEYKDDLKPLVSLGKRKHLKFSFSTASLHKLQKYSLLQTPDRVLCPFLVLLSESLPLQTSFVDAPTGSQDYFENYSSLEKQSPQDLCVLGTPPRYKPVC